MMEMDIQDKKGQLGEHLELLHSLAHELERAMQAIASNSLAELEDSIANQQALSARVTELANALKAELYEESAAAHRRNDDRLAREIRAASGTLQTLNQRYSALLQHSSRSVAMMVSLFSSFKGQIQEGPGARLKQQTWSCRV
jgi:peptidoglycan hydrolase CwlO-like protein